MDWNMLGLYALLSVTILAVIWKVAKKAFRIAVILAIAIAIYGVATGALTSAKSPQDFINSSIGNSKQLVKDKADRIQGEVIGEAKSKISDIFE